MKFFVYTIDKNELEFIEEEAVERFAASGFDPDIMEFSGIAIEANDIEDALSIYHNPGCGFGEYILSTEPAATVVRRQIREASNGIEESFTLAKSQLDYLRLMLKMKLAAARLQEISNLISEVSDGLHAVYGRPKHITPDVIFDRLSETTIAATMKYGNQKKPG